MATDKLTQNLRELIGRNQSHTPLPELIERLNATLRGWANYFEPGHPRKAKRDLNSHLRKKLTWHLQRRSQRAWKPFGDKSDYAHLNRMGLIQR